MEFVYSDIEIFEKLNMAGFRWKGQNIFYVNADGIKPRVIKDGGNTIRINLPADKRAQAFTLIKMYAPLAFFNGHAYDSQLINNIMAFDFNTPTVYKTLKRLSDDVISKVKPREWDKNLIEFDLKEQLAPNISLKKFEAMSGKPIKESSIPFDKPDNFDLSELLEVVRYNARDLEATEELAKLRENYINDKKLLIENYGGNNPVNWKVSNGTIAGRYLMGYGHLSDEPTKNPPSDFKSVPSEAVAFLHDVIRYSAPLANAKTQKEKASIWAVKDRSLELYEFGNIITFGSGGLHSAQGYFTTTKSGKKRPHYDVLDIEDVYQLDVTSLFPNLIINHGLLGSEGTPKFSKMVKERIYNKKHNPDLAKAQKIVVNSVYGLLRLPNSRLFQPTHAGYVNVYGQIATYDLGKSFSTIGKIIQMNTDAVTVKLNDGIDETELFHVKQLWEDRFQLNLEVSHFQRFIQRDVNNYIAVYDNGKIKAKGSLSRSQKEDVLKNTSPRILQMAIADYLINGTPVETTIKEFNNPLDYVFILHAQRTANLTGNIVGSNGNKLDLSTQRVLATTTGEPIYKERKDGGLQKFPNCPDNITTYNDSLDDVANLDYNYYIELTNKALKNWTVQN